MNADQLAYIDPVSGSILLQLLIAGATSVVVCFRKSLKRLLFPFGARRDQNATDAPTAPESTRDGS